MIAPPPPTQAREATETLHPAYFQHFQVCGGAGSAKRQGRWALSGFGPGDPEGLRDSAVLSGRTEWSHQPTWQRLPSWARQCCLGPAVNKSAQPRGKGCGEQGSLRDAHGKPAGGRRTRSRQGRCSNSTEASWGPHHGEVGGGEIRNLRSKASVDVAMGRCQSSRSQQEACSWPLEPQEGDQAPGEGGSKGVDEFL